MSHLTEVAKRYRLSPRAFIFWWVTWTVLAIIMAKTEIADSGRGGFNGHWWEPWSWAFTASYSYALLAPIVVYCCHLWPYDRHTIVRTSLKLLALYVPVAMIFISLMLAFRHIVYLLILDVYYPTGDIVERYSYEFPKTLSLFFVVVFVSYTRIYQEKAQQEQLHSARLQSELVSARLDALRQQLQPHFLFNTLNLISSTLYEDQDKADSILTRLADLLRFSLTTRDKPFISFEQEINVLQAYLDIARMRFEDRLSIKVDIESSSLNVMVPTLILQPLVENAIKFGVEQSSKPSYISVNGHLDNGKLIIVITNSIVQEGAPNESFGIGLNNTKQRLNYLYPDEAELSLTTTAKEALVTLVLPLEHLPNE